VKCVYASQQTQHSSGLRAICFCLSHASKELPFCLSTVSFRVCLTPCLNNHLEFRRAQRVSRFAGILMFILTAISGSSEFQESESEGPLLKVPLGSHNISKKTARSCHDVEHMLKTIMKGRYKYKTSLSSGRTILQQLI